MPTVDNVNSDLVSTKSMHFAVRIRFIRQHVHSGDVLVIKCSTASNLADAFTKQLGPADHARIRALLLS